MDSTEVARPNWLLAELSFAERGAVKVVECPFLACEASPGGAAAEMVGPTYCGQNRVWLRRDGLHEVVRPNWLLFAMGAAEMGAAEVVKYPWLVSVASSR